MKSEMMTGLTAEQIVSELRDWIVANNNLIDAACLTAKLDEMTKPKPIEFWKVQYPSGSISDCTYSKRENAERELPEYDAGSRIVHFVEVP